MTRRPRAHALDAKAEQASLEGVRDLRQAGPLKVRQEFTPLEEVMAVTNE